MADTKITALAAITTVDPAADVLPIVDISDTSMAASGTTKKITSNQILGAGGTATLASATITGDLTVDTSTLVVNSSDNRVGIGTSVSGFGSRLKVSGDIEIVGGNQTISNTAGFLQVGTSGANGLFLLTNGTSRQAISSTGVVTWENISGVAGTAMTLNSTGLGVGVTPSAWNANSKALQLGSIGTIENSNNADFNLGCNYNRTSGGLVFSFGTTKYATAYSQNTANGTHAWLTSTTAGNAGASASFTQAMTLDASGNLLVGTTSGTFHRILKNAAAGEPIMDWVNFGSNGAVAVCTVDRQTYASANAAACALRVGDAVGTRSINASGTINASGADYAEYMTKAGDFTIAKGDVAGIDANGKLTNVFADAVSFVVKSTDPSYVGNDKWGTGIEGDALEAARQLVDRIAFAGQVPVNVTGAKAGDYIVPVVNGTGIKGQTVSNPTFEQYQLAVGKVIAIDADGRARIIVKVA
jgi:hypothetical protein